MGRRSNRTVSSSPGQRNSIGDFYVDNACIRLDKAARQEAAMYVDRIRMDSILINALFDGDQLSKLRQAYGLCEPSSWHERYHLTPHAPGTVTLNFKGTGVVTPVQRCYMPDDAARPFFDACRTLADLHARWGAVKHMLRWFNRNATLGAIRHYWPAAVTLCPSAPSLRGLLESPAERFNTPPGVTALLPLIRETAATVATLQLLGDRPVNTDSAVSLTLSAGVGRVADTEIELNAITFQL